MTHRKRFYAAPLHLVHAMILFGTATAAEPQVHFPPGTSTVDVPFRDSKGMIAVDVRVNGSEPLSFIIETGWSQTNLLMAEEIGGIEFDFTDAAETDNGGSAVRHRIGRLARDVHLEIGGLRFERVDMEVAAKGDHELLALLPEDGILGAQFLENVVVEIDWQNGRLRLHDPTTFRAPQGFTAVPLERRVGLVFASGEVTVDGKSQPLQFIVDTGSAGTLLLRADRVGVPKRRISGVTLGRSLYGPVTGHIGRVERLTFGGATLQNMAARFLDESSNMVAVGADGNLGTGVLRRYVVIFDYANARMLLKPTDAIKDPFPFTTSGVAIDGKLDGDGTIGIVNVYEGSPAARAGLAAGDRIVAVNSIAAADLGVDGVLDQMRQAPGTKMRLEVRQAGSVREVELELEALL